MKSWFHFSLEEKHAKCCRFVESDLSLLLVSKWVMSCFFCLWWPGEDAKGHAFETYIFCTFFKLIRAKFFWIFAQKWFQAEILCTFLHIDISVVQVFGQKLETIQKTPLKNKFHVVSLLSSERVLNGQNMRSALRNPGPGFCNFVITETNAKLSELEIFKICTDLSQNVSAKALFHSCESKINTSVIEGNYICIFTN